MKSNYQPIIIIGAARSGTNMLRDILSQFPNCTTWDCDEINPIWRHGNLTHPNDRFTSEMADDNVVNFIKKQFSIISKRNRSKIVIEKTCANSLRIPFIRKVFPNAKFIFIRRDPRDAVSSSILQYKSSFDLNYSIKKLRYTPLSDIFYYLKRYGLNRVRRFLKKEVSLKVWGVQFHDIQGWSENKSLHEICAKQWLECVDTSIKDFDNLGKDRCYHLYYEEFVNDPMRFTKELAKFMSVEISDDIFPLSEILNHVSNKSIGKFNKHLSPVQINDINHIVFGESKKYIDYRSFF